VSKREAGYSNRQTNITQPPRKNLYKGMKKLILLVILALHGQVWVFSQNGDPLPAQCSFSGTATESSTTPLVSCQHTSNLWTSNDRFIPDPNARSIKVRANFIILQKTDGTGNFQDIPEHRDFLNDWFNTCNGRFANLWGISNCQPRVTDIKIQIVPNWIFLPDPDPTEFNWNNDNESAFGECPSSTWWLNGLDASISSNPSIPKGINVYLTVDGSVYNQLVVLGTIDNPQTNGMAYTWCSEQPSVTNLNRSSRIAINNLYLKYWWFKNHPNIQGQPFSVTRQWLVDEGGSLAHEFGHSFISCYVHKSGCQNHIMSASNGGSNNFMLADDAGCIHRNLAISNLRQFIDCDETYRPDNLQNPSPTNSTFDRIVSTNELWDLNMRVYSNIRVKTGATLTVTCKLLMPQNGFIEVERGARLIVDGGTITRANTCSPSQLWRGVVVSGNNTQAQPQPNQILNQSHAGVVILKGQGIIESAILGVNPQGLGYGFTQDFHGGVVDVDDFTFKDCSKGVQFATYQFPNISRFKKTNFIRTSTGSSSIGVGIGRTNGILFEECNFLGMTDYGISAYDAVFNVKEKNKFSGSKYGISAGASAPLAGQIQVGVLGAQGADRNLFEDNIVGIRATSNARVQIFSNDFANSNFDIALNGATQSAITNNFFKGSAAGNQFDNTGDNSNQNLCNTYVNNTVGTNIVGKNTGFLFRQENFATLSHDLFIEGLSSNPGAIQPIQGNTGNARWNYFSTNKPENIKTSTVSPWNNTTSFIYFHPNPNLDARLKPKCASNDACPLQSNFSNILTNGDGISNCMFPNPPEEPICESKPCLDDIRQQIAEKSAEMAITPTAVTTAEIQMLTTNREYVTDALIRSYLTNADWTSVEILLNEDLNPANQRRLVGAKIEQQEFSTAKTMLHDFPKASIEDQYFVQVQGINLERLMTPQYNLSTEQEAELLTIAETSSPEAGYAQTLLSILTGRDFMPRLPDLGSERSVNQRKERGLIKLFITPQPAHDQLQIQIPVGTLEDERFLELRSLTTGAVVQHIDVKGMESVLLPVQQVSSGLYLLVLREQGTVLAIQKVMIQH
jgi:hypothetical protein